eukprot:gnl/MRDRNA2_/MRDRNA2_183673_c0_seq1.p1 gnl/MRDRNA2_/MRDRNA2_183673_c0~~gnl/MRDRNA2_/MRDRNA2_183673_c0_seq1.p1  ORF type:complete len:346 (+),score=71.22 gnl/MRDRNA2_/MRDRNA2_183673_c0_seq1:190-1227(+)
MFYQICHALLLGLAMGGETDSEGTCSADGDGACTDVEAAQRRLKSQGGLYKHGDDFIWQRLFIEEGIEKGAPCKQEVLGKYDNLNLMTTKDNVTFYGPDVTREILQHVHDRGGVVKTVVDLGSGYGGTTRVLIQTLGGDSTAHGIEIRESVHRAAGTLDSMAALAGDIPSGAIQRVRADVVNNVAMEGSLPEPGSVDLLVSRFVMLHIAEKSWDSWWRTLTAWLKPGAMIAIENWVADDIPDDIKIMLNDKTSVPWVPSEAEFKATLDSHGFKDVEFEYMGERWKPHVSGRLEAAKANAKSFDENYGEEVGKNLRDWYHYVNFLMYPPEGQRTGVLGVRIYATKA